MNDHAESKEHVLHPDTDYVLKDPGDWVWITVGGFSLRVKHTKTGGLVARAWVVGAEDGVALGEIELETSDED
jgi:hypothetical protein